MLPVKFYKQTSFLSVDLFSNDHEAAELYEKFYCHSHLCQAIYNRLFGKPRSN